MTIKAYKWHLLVLAFVIFGFINRIYHISERPLHHDESIHSTLSLHWYNNPDTAYYKYDPTYHGTFLYMSLRTIYELLGVGVTQARLFPLIFALGIWFLPLLFRGIMSRTAIWVAIVALAVSPLMTYYSRFIVHDMPTLFFTFTGIAFLIRYFESSRGATGERETRYLIYAGISFGILQAIKLISLINFFLLAVFFLLCALRKSKKAIFDPITKFQAKHFAVATGVFLLVFAFINTSFFRYPEGFLAGLVGKNLSYWWNQHQIERVKGPVAYHLYSMFLHELPFLIIGCYVSLKAASRHRFGRPVLTIFSVIVLFTVPRVYPIKDVVSPMIASALEAIKIKQSIDLSLYLLCGISGLLGTWQFLNEGKRFKAFMCFWTFGSLAIFSFAGEKGPWLCVHVAYPLILLSAISIGEWLERQGPLEVSLGRIPKVAMAVGIAALLYQGRIAVWVTHITDGEPRDILSQVHNSRDVQQVIEWIKRTSYETGEKDKIPIATIGETTWAFYFYLLADEFHNFKFDKGALDGKERFVIGDEGNFKELEKPLTEKGYRVSKLILNGWYTPEDFNPTWVDWITYAWRRSATNIGTRPMFVFYKPLWKGE